jgi:hypothetical protein
VDRVSSALAATNIEGLFVEGKTRHYGGRLAISHECLGERGDPPHYFASERRDSGFRWAGVQMGYAVTATERVLAGEAGSSVDGTRRA